MMVVKKKVPVKKKLTVKKKEERGKSAPIKKKPEVDAPALEVRFVMREESQKPSLEISEAQKFQLDVIARTNFNLFNGKKIVELLKQNRKMWRAVLLPLNLISLRDMENDTWHADTLYIYVEEGWQFSLEELVKEQFKADEIQWIGGSGAIDMLGTTEIGKKSNVILSVWWD